MNIQPIYINIRKLKFARWNYKNDDEFMAGQLKENIRRNGQVEVLIIRPMGKGFEVINGNHRLKVMKALGKKKCYCVNLGRMSKVRAMRIAIELNETRFKSDIFRLSDIIKVLKKEFSNTDLYKTMPFHGITIEELASLTKEDTPRGGGDNRKGDDGMINIATILERQGVLYMKMKDAGVITELLSAIIDARGLKDGTSYRALIEFVRGVK